MLTVCMEGFEAFQKIKDEQDPAVKETRRCIAVPTPCDSVKLLLSLHEVYEFDHILEEADAELRSCNLLQLFNGN